MQRVIALEVPQAKTVATSNYWHLVNAVAMERSHMLSCPLFPCTPYRPLPPAAILTRCHVESTPQPPTLLTCRPCPSHPQTTPNNSTPPRSFFSLQHSRHPQRRPFHPQPPCLHALRPPPPAAILTPCHVVARATASRPSPQPPPQERAPTKTPSAVHTEPAAPAA